MGDFTRYPIEGLLDGWYASRSLAASLNDLDNMVEAFIWVVEQDVRFSYTDKGSLVAAKPGEG